MTDKAASVAQNAAAPAAERHDAEVEFRKAEGVSGLAAQLLPSAEIQPVIDFIESQWEDSMMAKGGVVIKGPWADRKRERGGQSVFVDDFQVQAQGAYWDRPGLLGFDSMRAMVEQTPILNSIILTRIRQVNRFCRPQMGGAGPGFLIKHIDPNHELSPEQQDSVQRLTKFITNCGWEAKPRLRKKLKRDAFHQFMAKFVRDSLTMDASPIETEFKRDRSLGLDGFYSVDGATVRLCTEEGYDGDDQIFALQVIQGNIRHAYTMDDLVYEVRNPRSDVTACGYGYSETEMLIKVVTYLLNAMTYNGSFFDKNSIPRGLLQLVGNYDPSDLAAFKRAWNAMIRGVQNSHNMPVMVAKDTESKAMFTEIGGQLDEMAFAKWLTFLTSIACSMWGIAPEEVSMESFAASKSALSGNDTEEKIVSSTDKGLRPLLTFGETVLSDFVIQEFSEEFQFAFVGLDDEDKQAKNERQKLTMRWNEMRALDGLDPVQGPMGDAPMNPVLITPWLQEQGIGQEQEDFGDPDAADAEADGGAAGEDEEQDSGEAGDGDASGGGAPDFGSGEAGSDDMAKALSDADFGLPPVWRLEV